MIAVVAALASSCQKNDSKPNPVDFPRMEIKNLHDAEIAEGQFQLLDLDQDGTNDIIFNTWLIGDPLDQEDELLFFAGSSTSTSLLVDHNNGSPRFSTGDVISVSGIAGHDWYAVSQVELALRNTGLTGNPYWELQWKDATHKFLGVQVRRNGRLYNGWVELSMNAQQSKLILHRMAISTEPDRNVKAG